MSGSPVREIEHPSTFPSLLRRDRHSPSVTPPRRETPSPTHRHNKRHSMGSFNNLNRSNIVNYNRRDSLSGNGVRDMKRDYVGSTSSLSRKSSLDTKKSSSDSLDNWHITWDSDRNNSISSNEERLSFGYNKVIISNSTCHCFSGRDGRVFIRINCPMKAQWLPYYDCWPRHVVVVVVY